MTKTQRTCLQCGRAFMGSSGRGYCSTRCREKRAPNLYQQTEAPMSASQVERFLDEAVRRECAMPWECVK